MILIGGGIVFGLILTLDLVMIFYYIFSNHESDPDLISDYSGFQLFGIILSGMVQVILLIVLPFIYKKFKKALRLHKLQNYFKENRFPRYSVMIFFLIYVARACLWLSYAIWACYTFSMFHHDKRTFDDIKSSFFISEEFLFIDEVLNISTVVLCFIFFYLLSKSRARIRAGITVIDAKSAE